MLHRFILLLFFTHQLTAVQEIIVGTSLSLHAEGKLVERGMQAAFAYVNKINKGEKFILKSSDDGKRQDRAVKNIEELKATTPFFVGIEGFGVVDQLREKNLLDEIVCFGPAENSTHLYEAALPGLILVKPPLRDELEEITSHIIDTLKRKKIAIFFVENEYGRNGRDDTIALLGKRGIEPVAMASYPDKTIDIQAAASQIAAAVPDAIICIARRHATYNFILNTFNKGLIQTVFVGTSYLQPIQDFLRNARGIELHARSLLVDPMGSDQHAQLYRKAMEEQFGKVPPSPLSFEGFMVAYQFAQIALQVKGELTRDSFLRAYEKHKKSSALPRPSVIA